MSIKIIFIWLFLLNQINFIITLLTNFEMRILRHWANVISLLEKFEKSTYKEAYTKESSETKHTKQSKNDMSTMRERPDYVDNKTSLLPFFYPSQ